jgi:peptidoglycan hydrolase FlgJ
VAISLPTDIVLDVARAASPEAVETAKAALARRSDGTQAASAKEKEAGVKFEAMVLGSFIGNMLPKQADAVYGQGLSGEMWQSLMAQQLGEVLAERGGIGIADRLLKDRYVEGETTQTIGPVAINADNDRQQLLSTAMVQEIQRRLTDSIMENLTPDDTKAL